MTMNFMRFAVTSLAVAGVLALFASPAARATTQTGELQGYVVDDSGLPIAGARVILSSPQMIGGEKVVPTDADGRFRFSELDPGKYTVEISHADFRGFTEENIEVGIGAKVVKDYLLEPAAKTAEGDSVIHVVATAPMIDTTKTSMGMSFRPDLTDRTVTSRQYQDIALLAPGVVNVSGDGNPSIHGGLPVSNLYLLDGLNITDPLTQTFSTNFNFDSIGELQVLTGGLDAEYGGTTGGVINIVTKSGGDDFTLDGSVYWAPKELHLLDKGEINDSNSVEANLAIGGPIIRRKLWFFVSGQYIDDTTTTPATGPSLFPDVAAHPPEHFSAFYGLGKLTWQMLPWEKVSLLIQGDPAWITNALQDLTVHPDAEEQRSQGGVKIIGTSSTTLSDNLLWKTQIGYGATSTADGPQTNDFTKPGHTNDESGGSTLNFGSFFNDSRYRMNLETSLTYFLQDFVGDHEIKAGLGAGMAWDVTVQGFTGNPAACFGHRECSFEDNGTAQIGSSVSGAGDPFQVTVYDAPLAKTVTGNGVSAYVQDTWRPARSVTIRPGLRFDSNRGYNDAADGGLEIYNFNTVTPRIGVAWDPFGDGKTEIRGGYYVYNEAGLLLMTQFVGRSQASTTFAFDENTQSYSKLVSQETGSSDSVTFKKGMKPPTMYEGTFGVAREIVENAAVSVDLTYRRRQNSFEDDESNVIWDTQGSNAIGFRNGVPTFIFSLGTPDNAIGQYIGLDVALEKRLADNWQALLTYTLARDEGTSEEYATTTFDNPRQAQFEYGFLQDDVRHNLALTLSYDLPFGFGVGGTATYQSGGAYSKLFKNNLYGSFSDRRAPRGFDPGKDLNDPSDDIELRLPDQTRVDVRVTWRLKELTSQDIWLIADVRNLLNSRPVTSIENRDVPTYGQTISRASPARAELAIRYMF